MRYFKYGNSGGIDRVIAREINSNSGYYNSIDELIDSAKEPYLKNLGYKHYGFDARLDRDVYMVVAEHKDYKEIFVCFFVEDDHV